PPENLLLKYPAIVYSRSDIRNRPADDMVYSQFTFYDLTVIDKNPDSLLVYAVASLPRCKFGRHYKSDNLNHDTLRSSHKEVIKWLLLPGTGPVLGSMRWALRKVSCTPITPNRAST